MKGSFRVLLLNVAFAGILFSAQNVLAATRTWDGEGATNNWSEAANWSGDTVPAGLDTAVFDATSSKDCVIDINIPANLNMVFNMNAGYTGTVSMASGTGADFLSGNIASGTFAASDGTISFRSNFSLSGGSVNLGAGSASFFVLNQSGGTFNGSTGDANFSLQIQIDGGDFNAPSGNLNLSGNLSLGGGTFNHNGGTINLVGPSNISISPVTVNNLTINKQQDTGPQILGTMRVVGTVTLIDGMINGGIIKAENVVGIVETFGGQDGGGGTVLIQDGASPRTLTLPAGVRMPNLRINDASVNVVTSGAGTIHTDDLFLENVGTVEFGANSLTVGYNTNISGSPFTQNSGAVTFTTGNFTMNTAATFTLNGGTFSMESGTADLSAGFSSANINGGTFNATSGTTTFSRNDTGGAFTQTGGIFNGNGPLDINSQFQLSGGIFNAPPGNIFLSNSFSLTGSGTFNHSGGTVTFDTSHPSLIFTVSTNGGREIFNNLAFNHVLTNGEITFNNTTFQINGSLQILNGRLSGTPSAWIDARGDVVIGADADGGNANVRFAGGNNQTFTNSGGLNTTGTWTIDKPAGVVTAATDLLLVVNQPLNINSGTLYLNSGSDLQSGALTVGTNGRLVNDSAATITLGGDIVNNGIVDLQGGGAMCPESDAILLRSTTAGTRRSWSGTGNYRLVDVDVQDMGGTSSITVFSGTNSGNNNANWTFSDLCPPELSVSPQVSTVNPAGTRQFTAAGGFTPRTFSIAVNNSGGSINSVTGLYIAGTISNVTDTIRVTDLFGTTAEATVSVVNPPSRLAFSIQPTNAIAGETFNPAVQVTVQDQSGNTVITANSQITLNLQNNSCGGSLEGQITQNAVNGIATFSGINIRRACSGYTIQAEASGLTSAVSSSFDINAAAPARLSFAVQPSNTGASTIMTPAIQIAVEDEFGNRVTSATNAVSVVPENNPGSATLSGTTLRNAVGGVAVFDNLSLNQIADGYTLRASSSGLSPVVSNAFNVTRGAIFVTNRNNSGAGSLRQAILDANNVSGADEIKFNIPDQGPYTIEPMWPLPEIRETVSIDGTTQPGYNGTPIIEISGTASNNIGLNFLAGNCTVKGLVINRMQIAMRFFPTSDNNVIQGNYVGTDVTGTIAAGNYAGILMSESENNLIGGQLPSEGNLVSGNTYGIYVVGALSANNSINKGLVIDRTPFTGNSYGAGGNNFIQGNYIGTDVTGTISAGNYIGVLVYESENNLIGGQSSSGRNLISGNTYGIWVEGARADDNSIKGNHIGTGADGISDVHNDVGIFIRASNTSVGGIGQGDANLIAFNGYGVLTYGPITFGQTNPINNSIRGNSIHSSDGKGISFSSQSYSQPTPNDPGDADTGPNNKQNFPVMDSAVSASGVTTIRGTLNSIPSSSYTIDFYSNPFNSILEFRCRFMGLGEGRQYLGSTVVNTSAANIGSFEVTLPVAVASGDFLAATATDINGNTSEFSQCRSVSSSTVSISGRITDSAGSPLRNARVVLSGGLSRQTLTDSNGLYSFGNLPNNSNYSVTSSLANYDFSPVSRNYTNLDSNQVNQNFVGTKTRASIRGFLRSSSPLNPAPLAGVTVILSGTQSRTLKRNGLYLFNDLPPGNYTITAIKDGWTFTPPTIDVTLGTQDQSINLIATPSSPLEGRIFLTGNSGIGSINADGTAFKPNLLQDCGIQYNSIENVTHPNANCGDRFDVSPNGRSIVFVGLDTGSIRTAYADGSGQALFVARGNRPILRYPSRSPDSSKITYSMDNTGIYIKNSDGSGTADLINFPPNTTTATAHSWIDNETIVFVGGSPLSPSTIYSVKTDGSQLTNLGPGYFAKASPDGAKIAFSPAWTNSALHELWVMNADGTGRTLLRSDLRHWSFAWSPDGTRLTFIQRNGNANRRLVAIDAATGGSLRVIKDFGTTNAVVNDWSVDYEFPTPMGSNVPVIAGATEITFGGISTAGTTTFTPIEPSSAGAAPNGFVLGNLAFEINTTAAYTAPVTVCFNVPASAAATEAAFNQLALLHNENGVLINRTTSRDFTTRKICGVVSTLSPFVLGEEIDPALPSITGFAEDAAGNPLSEVFVRLTGTENRTTQTDASGVFSFVNLTENGDYNVQPKLNAHIFTEYSQDFPALTGENSVVFTGTESFFQISGRVTDGTGAGLAGVRVQITGSEDEFDETDSTGNYAFTNLPADGSYEISVQSPTGFTSPASRSVEPLLADVSDVDFIVSPPTAATASIGGRIMTSNGHGIRNAAVTITGPDGTTRTAVTGSFGFYRFEDLEVGETYVITVSAKKYSFANPTRVISLNEDLNEENFVADDR